MKEKITKVLYNGKIHTMDKNNCVAEAIAIAGEKIAATGSNKDILESITINGIPDDTVEIYDLKGRTVIPGIIETHTHLSWTGLSELYGEVFIPLSVRELLQYVRERVKTLPEGEWIFFKNTYPTRLKEYRFPTLQELDEAAPLNPVFVDGAYAGQANSYALRLAGIDEKTPDPATGKIMRDKATGKPNGLLFLCTELIRSLQKPVKYSIDEFKRGIINMQKHYNSFGITSVIDGISDNNEIHAVNELYAETKLNVRTTFTQVVASKETAEQSLKASAEQIKAPSGWAKLSFCKAMIDGGILTGTAYMRKPYKDDIGVFGIDIPDFRGLVRYTSEQLEGLIEIADEHKLQMTAHSIGDAATDILLDAYESYSRKNDIRGKRFSVIHCDFTDKAMLERIKALGLVILFQPAWHYMDANVLSKVLDEETMRSFITYRDYVKNDIKAAAGSDHMIKYDSLLSHNPYNPFAALYNMVTRKTREGIVVGGEQTISREDALRMYTTNAAYATFEENFKGSLEAGKAADLAVLSGDYFSCAEDEIPELKAVLTLAGGRVVHEV